GDGDEDDREAEVVHHRVRDERDRHQRMDEERVPRAREYAHRARASRTGSYPPRLKGLHDRTRFAASNPPITTPRRSIASMAYSEQVGVYRQAGGSWGLIRALEKRRVERIRLFILLPPV